MQKLAEICIRRPIFAAMLIMALVVIGAVSFLRLGVDRFPSVDLPTVLIRTALPGASTEDIESEVSEEIESVANTVEGVSELRSISVSGSSAVVVTFDLERDIDSATQDVRDRVQTVLRRLPDDAEPPVINKNDNDNAPVLTIALAAERPLRELTELADKLVKVQLERAEGVGEVQLVGGQERAIQIELDADRLAAYGIPITAVRSAIQAQNVNLPGGNVTSPRQEKTLRTLGRLSLARDFEAMVIASPGGVPIRLRDVGTVRDGTVEQRSIARLNGVPTVMLEVRRRSGGNTVAVIEAAKANLEKIKSQIPSDVKLEIIRDQSNYIYAALHEINLHLILGSLLACAVVLAFMRSWRSTLIAGIAIPASVVSTFGVMWALDFTLNSVTMLALVLMVGIVIDDAIVVLENIFRFIEEKKLSAFEAARQATGEIALAVLATTLSLVVIFLPVSFMSSISGRFLFQFGITAAVAVMVSLLVSFTLTPMMSARLLRSTDAMPSTAYGGEEEAGNKEGGNERGAVPSAGDEWGAGEPGGDRVKGRSGIASAGTDARVVGSRAGFYGRLERRYLRTLGFCMRHRLAVSVVALGIMASSVPLYGIVRQEYLPSDVDEAEFEINVTAPLGASLAAMDEVMRQVSDDISKVKGVRTVMVNAGGGFINSVSSGTGYVRIAPHEERTFSISRLWRETLSGHPLKAFEGNYTQRDVMMDVRKTLKKYRDLRCSVRNIPSFNIGGGNWDIDFTLKGPDLNMLSQYGEALRLKSAQLGGIVDADTTLKLDKPELEIRIDRERAASLGVETAAVASALRLMVGGELEVSRFRDDSVNDNYNVQLRLKPTARDRAEVIRQLYVPRTVADASVRGGVSNAALNAEGLSTASSGNLIRLDNVVTLADVKSPSRIDRLDRLRLNSLRAGVAPGFALADRLDALKGAVEELNMPPAYTWRILGKGRELEKTFREFLWAFLLSIVFMYMILASQFESLTHPFTILVSLPLSVPFALISLWATGNTLNLYSALGMLVLFGVVKKNAILQVDHMNKLKEAGASRLDAVMHGNRDRLRPILMTTLALVAGMLPLWLGTGPGSEERRAIAVIVIGGQSLSLVLTLLVTPVVWSLLDEVRERKASRAVQGATH